MTKILFFLTTNLIENNKNLILFFSVDEVRIGTMVIHIDRDKTLEVGN